MLGLMTLLGSVGSLAVAGMLLGSVRAGPGLGPAVAHGALLFNVAAAAVLVATTALTVGGVQEARPTRREPARPWTRLWRNPAFRAVHELREEMGELASRFRAGAFPGVVRIGGRSLMGEAGEVLGFEVREHTFGNAMQRYFFVGLDALYSPRGLRPRAPRRWPVEASVSGGVARAVPLTKWLTWTWPLLYGRALQCGCQGD